jgi:chemotaxis protein histidine kinase CheA
MMNDGKEWQLALPEFLLEAEMLLAKSEECLAHLHLIRNDSDAIDCMKSSLTKLAEKADSLALRAISEFSRHIQYLISNAANPLQLHDQALDALSDCLTLLAWQLELIDAKTGKLSLDESEQSILIATAAQQIPQKDFGYKPRQHLPHAS